MSSQQCWQQESGNHVGSSSVNGKLSFHGDQISAHTATNNLLVDEDMRVNTRYAQYAGVAMIWPV